MQLFVLGATGRTGRHLIESGLARGHSVTAFVRSPKAIGTQHERLKIVQGDPYDAKALAAAMAGHDVVLSALGPRGSKGPHTLLRDCARSTIEAMRTAGVSRIVIVSAALAFAQSGPLYAFFRWMFSDHVADILAMEALLSDSGLDWTIVRPPRLIPTRWTGYRWQVNALPPLGLIISWRAVASCMLDLADRRTHVREILGICT
jgi:putative NADH-flavin reductase